MNKRLLSGMVWLLVVWLVFGHTPAQGYFSAAWEDPDWNVEPQQSTTGPYPPLEVLLWDEQKAMSLPQETKGEVVLNTPAYYWRHGCGPTAVGMVVGYYDTKGYDNLIPGGAWTQTAAVSQMIASGGNSGAPCPPGSEQHFEDYALPIDDFGSMQTDNYLTAGRAAHANNSMADYLGTSRSSLGNPYGWSWSTEMGYSFRHYFHRYYPEVTVETPAYYAASGGMTWDVLVQEINAGRPMVFLVDTNGDGVTDHFVTAIGYRSSPTRQYAMRDTWSTSSVRWENFAMVQSGVRWGIWGGYAYRISHPPTDLTLSNQSVVENLPVGSQVGSFSTSDPLLGDLFTYSFVAGSGSTDNGLFRIAGSQLLTDTAIDYESRTGYSVRVRSSDSGGDWVERSFSITVSDVNEAPFDITLAVGEVDVLIPAGSEVGRLSTLDQDAGETFVYSLDCGLGGEDNGSFTIAGDRLMAAEEIDFGQQGQYSVRVRSTDAGGLFIQKILVISMEGVENSYVNSIFLPVLVK
ncbi:MAG: hypothetical protein Q7U53_03180 [Anaerolineaceae bacterium]|nr:hypothetical protein [Anaerolineaceae bacterium]